MRTGVEFNEDMNLQNIDNKLMKAVENGIKKRKREERKVEIIKKISALLTGILLTVLGCFLSPTFAEGVSKVPILNILAKLVERDKDVVMSYGNHYGKNMSIKYESENGNKIEFIYGMRDDNSLVLFYKIDTVDGKKIELGDRKFFLKHFKIKDINGKLISTTPIRGVKIDDNNSGIIRLDKYFTFFEDKTKNYTDIKNEVYLSGALSVMHWAEFDRENIIEFKDFRLPIGEIDYKEPKVVDINKEIDIDGRLFNIEKMDINPLGIELKLTGNKPPEGYHFNYSIEADITDEKGNAIVKSNGIWGNTKSNKDKIEYLSYYESVYFGDVKELRIKKFNVSYTKGPERIVLSIPQKSIIIGNGHEYFSVERLKDDENYYEITLVPKVNYEIPMTNKMILVGGNDMVGKSVGEIEELMNKRKNLKDGVEINVIPKEGTEKKIEDQVLGDENIKVYSNYEKLIIKIDKSYFEDNTGLDEVEILMMPNKVNKEVKCDLKLSIE